MSFIEIILLSLALAADAFSVGVAVGLNHGQLSQVFRVALNFGLFQSLMSLTGITAGGLFLVYIKQWDHWVAFILLLIIGAKMILNYFRPGDAKKKASDPTKGVQLIGLSLAVSIDALAAGVGLAAVNTPIILAVATIGIVALIATLISMLLAGNIGAKLGNRMTPVAGVVLIVLGIKILFDHL